MAKFASRGGVSVEAHVVSEDEKTLQARTSKGNELLEVGDALVTLKGKQYALPASLFEALFSSGRDDSDDAAGARAGQQGKGGQQKASEAKP